MELLKVGKKCFNKLKHGHNLHLVLASSTPAAVIRCHRQTEVKLFRVAILSNQPQHLRDCSLFMPQVGAEERNVYLDTYS